MINLFSNINSEGSLKEIKGLVPDLILVENFITDVEHDKLLIEIDKNNWSNELKRRVQHYGYKYDYRAKSINHTMKVGNIPKWANEIGKRLVNQGYFESLPDQLIINEYLSGQGITDHIDCEPCFEDTIVSISLGSLVTMNFTHKVSKERIPITLFPKSAVVLKGRSRFDWLHGIPARKTDIINQLKHKRKRRVSLTFRRVIIN